MIDNNPNNGFLYAAFGEKYVNEALISAKSLKAVDSTADVTIVSDQEVNHVEFDRKVEHKFQLDEQWKSGLVGKIEALMKTPYEKTIFLDSDTYVVSPINELFPLLDYFDFCLTMAPADISPVKIDGLKIDGLNCYNTGVIAYRNSDKVIDFLANWKKDYLNNIQFYSGDQPSFMKVFALSDIRVHVLQQHYNARTNLAMALPGAPAKVIHNRHKNYTAIAQRINKRIGNRIWDPVLQDVVNLGPSITPLKMAIQCFQRIIRGYQ